LGDIFFHLMFYAQLGKEQNLFDIEDIAQSVSNKMINRHPHVFKTEKTVKQNMNQLNEAWHQQKSLENNKERLLSSNPIYTNKSWMNDISKALPAFIYAKKVQQQAARVGFDWIQVEDVIEKLSEEVKELSAVINDEGSSSQSEELGDILFTCVNLARHLNLDPETCLRQSNHKFVKRFTALEQQYDFDHEKMSASSIDELEHLWQKIKSN